MGPKRGIFSSILGLLRHFGPKKAPFSRQTTSAMILWGRKEAFSPPYWHSSGTLVPKRHPFPAKLPPQRYFGAEKRHFLRQVGIPLALWSQKGSLFPPNYLRNDTLGPKKGIFSSKLVLLRHFGAEKAPISRQTTSTKILWGQKGTLFPPNYFHKDTLGQKRGIFSSILFAGVIWRRFVYLCGKLSGE